MAGKARLAHHRVEEGELERLGVTLSAGYAFMGAEEAEEGIQPTLRIYDDDTDHSGAGVRQNIIIETVVRWCVDMIDQLGCVGQKITSKTDQEPSIIG